MKRYLFTTLWCQTPSTDISSVLELKRQSIQNLSLDPPVSLWFPLGLWQVQNHICHPGSLPGLTSLSPVKVQSPPSSSLTGHPKKNVGWALLRWRANLWTQRLYHKAVMISSLILFKMIFSWLVRMVTLAHCWAYGWYRLQNDRRALQWQLWCQNG